MAEPPWSQYDQAYKRMHERLAEILAQLSTVKDPAKYLPVRLSDGSAFYNAGGGAGGGLVQNQIRNQSDTDWINEPFVRKIQTDQLPSTLTASGNLKVAVMEGGAGGGLSQIQVRSSSNIWTDVGYYTDNLNLPVQVQNAIDIIDKADRLLGRIYGSQGQQLKQRAATYELLVQVTYAGNEIDPRQVRQLTSSDIITLDNQISRDADGHGQVDVVSLPSIPAGTSTIGKINVNTPPGEANFVFEGDAASPTGAGEVTIKTVTIANGETRYITDVIGGGSVKGYVTVYWGAAVKWRGRFLADASVGEQLKTPIKIVGDGTTVLSLKVYASAAGNVEAFWGMTW